MGKQTKEKHSGMSPESSSQPTGVWGIQHIMKYYQWRQVKKKFMHRKQGGERNAARSEAPKFIDSTGVVNLLEQDKSGTTSSNVEEPQVQSTLRTKHSVKSRLKALITEEISRKKGRHNRSSTYPAKSPQPQSEPVHRVDTSEIDPLTEMLQALEGSKMPPQMSRNHHATDTLDVSPQASSEEPTSNNETRVDSDTDSDSDSSESSQIHKHGKEPTEDQTLLQQNSSFSSPSDPEEKLIRAKILTADASPQLFKDFLDALEIINSNKDFLVKVLHHPSSPLVHHYHSQQTFGGKMALNKSLSFPGPGSSSGSKYSVLGQPNKMVDDMNNATPERRLSTESEMQTECLSNSSEDFQKQSMSSNSSFKLDRIPSLKQDLAERGSNFSSVSVEGQNQMVMKRFKDLKQKIKHVIEDSKNERHRITRDGMIHKIPHGNNVSMELKKILEKCKDSAFTEGKHTARSGYDNRPPFYSFRKRQLSPVGTSSLKESTHRYSQLSENSFNKDIKYPKSERLRLRAEDTSSALKTAKFFKRFLSMPNLKSYFQQSDEPPIALSPMIPIRKFGESTPSISRNEEKKSFYHSDSNKLLDTTIQDSISKGARNKFIIGSIAGSGLDVNNEAYAKESIKMDEFPFLTDSDSAACAEQDAGATRKSAIMTEEAKSVSSEYSSTSSQSEDSKLNRGLAYELIDKDLYDQEETKVDYLGKHFDDLTSLVEVNARNKAEFNYVKEVLEISGFTGHESLATWYSVDQPVDPSVYEELEGCWLSDPNCSGNEGGQCNHLVLFDLINEVLVEIFGRSYSYYPRPLSSVCHLRLMPAGDRVLRQVWILISFYLSSKAPNSLSLDYYSSKDLSKHDGWMNLQFDSECIVLELDDLIFDDLMDEFIFDDLLEELFCT
ncbi:hypothetical protein L6164_013139 [Bauhinia variegata]|uniref:Uncharacterized protein n=1 Tax=Bauhinia variegata TaxID=167791 RepID=A0ACB9PC60_BAUVA|nr:hypothetical protein L6164_013139 [Bauhinia variegata]